MTTKKYKVYDVNKHKHLEWIGFRWVVTYIGDDENNGVIAGAFQVRAHARIFRDTMEKIDKPAIEEKHKGAGETPVNKTACNFCKHKNNCGLAFVPNIQCVNYEPINNRK